MLTTNWSSTPHVSTNKTTTKTTADHGQLRHSTGCQARRVVLATPRNKLPPLPTDSKAFTTHAVYFSSWFCTSPNARPTHQPSALANLRRRLPERVPLHGSHLINIQLTHVEDPCLEQHSAIGLYTATSISHVQCSATFYKLPASLFGWWLQMDGHQK